VLRRVLKLSLLLLPAWIALCMLGTWANYKSSAFAGQPLSWSRAATLNVVAYSDWALVLTPIVLFLAWTFPVELRIFYKAIPVHVVAMFCVASMDTLIRTCLNGFVYTTKQPIPFGTMFERLFLADAESDVWMYVVISVTAFVISYYTRFREKEMKALQLETLLARSQLSVLKMQLQPHFLFNTLHSISALMQQDVKAADKMVSCLGDLLRMSIAGTDAQEVPLRQELDFLEKYLEIQEIRFQGQLSVVLRIAPNLLDAAVPYQILQPLVENAIKHGISKRTEGGTIEIDIQRKEERLHIRIKNDAPPDGTKGHDETHGVGLTNTHARLHTLYGKEQSLEVRHLPDQTKVELTVPFRFAQQTQWDRESNHGTSVARI
jgi:two-component system, LytTR family, sensor kinase